ncbi:MAG: hypothetical protein HOH20_02425 [Rhodospirillaceae bacterium]|jgi:hypothetical protein|nr:hypothetical protein [Rhodospirillaceae bacterium]MBT5566316.1 hypothetical protein [Rhodospirillaceae bacterium]MBT6088409.1 hypothetical protein [Rhodospirillaceae bacterium]MBT6960378.1 hypothetical protein [Rhodospirillaceae bacterium]
MADTKSDRPTYTAEYIKGDFEKAVYLDSVHSDNLMTAFLGLGAEHWALRRRVMVLEKFMAEGKVIDPAVVEAYEPTPEEKVAWEAERDDFIERTFSVLTRATTSVTGAIPTEKVPAREP